MALTNDERIQLLSDAVRLQCRSFMEYIGESAPPVDIDDRPAVASAFSEMIGEKLAFADRLVEIIGELDAYADLTVAFDPRYTFFNFVDTKYALKTLIQELGKESTRANALLDQGGDDAVVGPVLEDMANLTVAHIVRVQDLLADVTAAPAATG